MPDKKNMEDLDARLLNQMLQDFLEESQEHLDQLNLKLTLLEENPVKEEIVNEIFRLVHTLKGTASFVGLDKFSEISHKMEDVFGLIRKGTLKVTTLIIDTMFEALEVLTTLRDKSLTNDLHEIDISWIIPKLEEIFKYETPVAEAKKNRETAGPPKPQKKVASETIRVATERLDSLMKLAGELITNRNRLNEFSEQLRKDELTVISSAINRLTGQIHSGIMRTRMIPVESLFKKFPGVVRTLAREQNKEVEFIIEGKETELDKRLIEQIHDPLVHLLRNAVGHGIETRKVRQRTGKSLKGKISLSSRHQENNVIIEVGDDGQGINPEKMKTLAVQKGLITPEQAEIMTDDQAIRLIFTPGFSTAERVTDVSGRGVGMDVVKEHVQKLRGMIDVRSSPGKGTIFRIQIPLTIAVIQVLLVKTGGLTYALPLNTVRETLRIDPSEIKTMEKNEVIFIRGSAYSLIRLDSILKSGSPVAQKDEKIPVVVVGLAEKRVAIAVDELLDKREVVIKSPGPYIGTVKGVEGAAVLADGRVTLIIDVEIALGNT